MTQRMTSFTTPYDLISNTMERITPNASEEGIAIKKGESHV
jgi:hypothetical protein